MNICKTEKQYISKIAPSAQKACKKYGYLPSVLIAQSCLENGYGIPQYFDNDGIYALLEANNMVGIKSELLNSSWDEYTVWNGKSLTKDTPEEYNGKMVTIVDNFRVYDTIEQSFCDFLLFIKYASNYGKNGTPKYGESILSIKNPESLIKKVAKLGYATGSTYPNSVIKIIKKHNLTKYDDLTNVEPSKYEHKQQQKKQESNKIKKISNKNIIDITSQNKYQIPASRGNNPIHFIVIHYLGVPNADNPYLYGGGYGGHYNIERNGKIYKAADPKTAVIWQCGGGLQGDGGHSFYKVCTNYNSIGIECGVAAQTSAKDLSGDSNLWYFTEETQESLVWLVSKLMDEYNININHVIRHYDVTGKICPNPYVKNNKFKTSWTWTEFKNNLLQYRKNKTITIPSKNQEIKNKDYLEKGDKGSDVVTMQKMLIALGYSCGSTGADGDFGKNTLLALQKFQKDNKLSSNVYDKETKTILVKLYNNLSKKPSSKKPQQKLTRLFVAKVTAGALYVRSGPGTENAPIADYPILKRNNLVDVYKIVKDKNKEDWYYIRIAGKYFGYSKASFLQRV